METNEIQTPTGVKYIVKKNCRKCFGRGYTGIDKFTGKKYACRCIKRIDVPEEKKEIEKEVTGE